MGDKSERNKENFFFLNWRTKAKKRIEKSLSWATPLFGNISLTKKKHKCFFLFQSVMVPFYTLVFGKQVFGNRRSGSNSSLIFSLLSIYTANNKFTSTLLEIFSVVASASRDFCLYLFIIIVASVLFGYWWTFITEHTQKKIMAYKGVN